MYNREEKEKFETLFSIFERRKRNLKYHSPFLRREREILKNILNFREEKEKLTSFSQLSTGEREILKNILNFREETEKS